MLRPTPYLLLWCPQTQVYELRIRGLHHSLGISVGGREMRWILQ